MNQSLLSKFNSAALPNWLFRAALALLAALPLLALPAGAHAACGRFGGVAVNDAIKLPNLPNADFGFPIAIQPGVSPVVGLWHVIYSTGSGDNTSTFNDTFDTWHSDGTEFEMAFLAPLGGNVCVGVWRPTGERSVSLHHVGWLFNPSTPAATASNTFTLDESINVSRDGSSYSGSFTFKIWNLDGSFTGTEVTGTIAATRINPS
jgi:hypothetical protein